MRVLIWICIIHHHCSLLKHRWYSGTNPRNTYYSISTCCSPLRLRNLLWLPYRRLAIEPKTSDNVLEWSIYTVMNCQMYCMNITKWIYWIIITAHRYLNTNSVYSTPTHICRCWQQWFRVSCGLRTSVIVVDVVSNVYVPCKDVCLVLIVSWHYSTRVRNVRLKSCVLKKCGAETGAKWHGNLYAATFSVDSVHIATSEFLIWYFLCIVLKFVKLYSVM
jgi:hypothetical protein